MRIFFFLYLDNKYLKKIQKIVISILEVINLAKCIKRETKDQTIITEKKQLNK